jgi:hypothetical protein
MSEGASPGQLATYVFILWGAKTCVAGTVNTALNWIKKTELPTVAGYNYQASLDDVRTCHSLAPESPRYRYRISWDVVMKTVGPIILSVDANDFAQVYQRGIMSVSPSSSPPQVNHAGLLVGYDADAGTDY